MVKGSKTSVKINGLRVSVGSWLPTAVWECGRPGNGITDACGGSEGHWNCEDAGRSTGWGCNPIRGAAPTLSPYRNGSAPRPTTICGSLELGSPSYSDRGGLRRGSKRGRE